MFLHKSCGLLSFGLVGPRIAFRLLSKSPANLPGDFFIIVVLIFVTIVIIALLLLRIFADIDINSFYSFIDLYCYLFIISRNYDLTKYCILIILNSYYCCYNNQEILLNNMLPQHLILLFMV